MNELRAFEKMLKRANKGFGFRQDYNPPSTTVIVEGDEEGECYFSFDESGQLLSISVSELKEGD